MKTNLTRKQFLGSALKGLGGAAALAWLASCTSSTPTATDASTDGPRNDAPRADAHAGADAPPAGLDATVKRCTTNGTIDTIASNHGHVLLVTKQDIQSGVQKTYDIQGTAMHAHSVVVTVAMFAMLQADTTVMLTSTVGGSHSHAVTIACA